MLPCLLHGTTVLVNPRSYDTKAPKIGDVIVLKSPITEAIIVKRIHRITMDETYEIRGDNRVESTDSRHFGNIERRSIIGKVVGLFP